MISVRFCLVGLIYTILILVLLDCGNIGPTRAAEANYKKSKSKNRIPSSEKCPKDRVHIEDFQMKMALCRPNISVVCIAKPSRICFRNRTKLKATAFVHRRTGQCLLESNISAYRTLRFQVEARRVINPNEDNARTLPQTHQHQRGKCLLKYICRRRHLRSINMECGSVLADEKGAMNNFTRQRAFWIAPADYTGFVHFSSEMVITSDERVLNISSAKIYVPGMEQQETNNADEQTDAGGGNVSM